MEKSYILAIDQGTSGTKAIIFDENGQLIVKATAHLQSLYPKEGFVEQCPEAIYQSVIEAVDKCVTLFEVEHPGEKHRIVSCGISNQRETFVLWDANGKPLHNALVWQCKRSVAVCERLKASNLEAVVHERTGLTIDPYFSASKAIWLYENVQDITHAIDSGNAYFGTVDTWLLYKLTNGQSFKTDHTNASRTLFFNIYDLKWDDTLLEAFNLSKLKLPEVTFSSDQFGTSAFNGIFDSPIPITGVIGDSQAAFFGEECFEPGMAKATLGTGSSILWNVDQVNTTSDNKQITTIGWSLEGQVNYGVEGIIVSCGATLEWLKNQLELFESHSDIERLATSIDSNQGVYLVPAFSGMGAPYWQQHWRASVHGITFKTTKAHFVRAGLEAIAYQLKDVITDIETQTASSLKELKVNGGITANGFLMQFIADVLQKPVVNMGMPDVSAWGAAAIAGLGCKLWTNLKTLPKFPSAAIQSYVPSGRTLEQDYLQWQDILKRKVH
ncbi:FGGY family carbohydrate kinase [Formosa sp. A9]|uniref:FGGY family carbohydrate kinase n=1 Tax=Formosa sp. A9 TaxID=3442641 RepID=UPI003EB7E105